MSGIYPNIPNIKVLVRQENETSVFIRQEGETRVVVNQDGDVNVVLSQPGVTPIVTGSFSSYAIHSISSSYADNAATAVSSSYAVSASYVDGGGGGGLPPRFLEPLVEYTIPKGRQANVYDIYIYGTLVIEDGTVSLPFGNTFLKDYATLITPKLYNMGVINNNGIIQIT